MPRKKIVQDIVPSERRTIRNIPIKEQRSEPSAEPVFVKRPVKKNKGGGKYFLSFIIVSICVAVIGIALSFSYSKAVVTITPKVSDFDIDGTFTAKKDAQNGDLGYEVVSVSDEIKQDVAATKGSLVETKAKGAVILYNNFSVTAQTLVAGTRLSDSRGLIYRTSKTVSIPGKKSTTPGNIEVPIVADMAGEEYNSGLSELKGDFKIVAYKGTSKYDTLYARLKTDIAGGFSGNKMTVDPAVLESATKTLKDSLQARIISKLQSIVPKDYILYDGAYTIEYTESEPVMKRENSAEINIGAVSYAAIFKSDSLIKYIAGKEIKKFPSDTYTIDGDEALQFKISNGKDFKAAKGTPLIFTLKGPISITGAFPEEKLKDELKGIRLKDSNIVFEKYASISNANALITPFWMRAFPNSPDKIIIEYKTPKN